MKILFLSGIFFLGIVFTTTYSTLQPEETFDGHDQYLQYLTSTNTVEADAALIKDAADHDIINQDMTVLKKYSTLQGSTIVNGATLSPINNLIQTIIKFPISIEFWQTKPMETDAQHPAFVPNPMEKSLRAECYFQLMLQYGAWHPFVTTKGKSGQFLNTALYIFSRLNRNKNETPFESLFTSLLSYGADINESYATYWTNGIMNGNLFKGILASGRPAITKMEEIAQQWSKDRKPILGRYGQSTKTTAKPFDQAQTNLLQQLLIKAGEVKTKEDRDTVIQNIQAAIDAGADPNVYMLCGKDTVTSLHYALIVGSTDQSYPVCEIVNTLINAGVKNNCRIATNKASIEKRMYPLSTIVKYAQDGRTGTADNDKQTPTNILLPLALINLLMIHYADPLARDGDGTCALDYVQMMIQQNPTVQYYKDLNDALFNGMKLYNPNLLIIATREFDSLASKIPATNSAREVKTEINAINLNQTNVDVSALFASRSKPTLRSIIDAILTVSVCDTNFKASLGQIIQGYIRIGGLLSDEDDSQLTVFDYAKKCSCAKDVLAYLNTWNALAKPRMLSNITIDLQFLTDLISQNEWGASSVSYEQFTLYLDEYLKTNSINAYDTYKMTLLCTALIPEKEPANPTILKIIMDRGAEINMLCGYKERIKNNPEMQTFMHSNDATFQTRAKFIGGGGSFLGSMEMCFKSDNLFSITTPLGLAILNGSSNIVYYLIQKNANINFQNNATLMAPFFPVAGSMNFCQKDARIQALTTPFEMACMFGTPLTQTLLMSEFMQEKIRTL